MRRSDPGSPRSITTEAPTSEVTGLRPARSSGGPAETALPTNPAATPAAAASGASASRAPEIEVSRRPYPVPVTVWRRVPGDPESTFDAVVPVDLPTVFRGYGVLPAVTGTEEEEGTWGVEGQERTVHLADGGRMREAITRVSYPGLMAYQVVPTRGVLRVAIRSIDGRFIFSSSEVGGTVIRWTYVFRPRRGARPIVRLVAPLWRRYASQVIDRLAEVVAEQPPRAAAPSPAAR